MSPAAAKKTAEAKPDDYGAMLRFASLHARKQFLHDLEAPSLVVDRFGTDRHVARYDVAEHDLDGAVQDAIADADLLSPSDIVALGSLRNLHRFVRPEMTALDKTQINRFTAALYDAPLIEAAYRRFIGDVVAPLLGTPVYFQSTPTVRVHFPGQTGSFRRPFYHSDIMLGHPPACVNVWLPITPVADSNSIRIMARSTSLGIMRKHDYDFDEMARRGQEDDKFADFLHTASEPVNLDPGRFLIFDPRCIHATQNNVSDTTRVSIDARVVPADRFYRGVGRRRMLFVPGHYYDAEPVG